MLRALFFIAATLWIVGGLATMQYNMSIPANRLRQYMAADDPSLINLNAFFVVVCGGATIILGLVLFGKWLAKQGKPTDAQPLKQAVTAPQAVATLRAPVLAPAVAPRGTTPNQLADKELLAKWSGWVRRGDELLMEYDFKGVHVGDGNGKVQIGVEVQQGSMMLFRLVNLFVVPQFASEPGYFSIIMSSTKSDATTGFIVVRTAPTPGDSTLLNVEGREDADKVFRLLMLGEDMNFTVHTMKEPILRLPLHNDGTFAKLYTQLEAEIRARR